MQPLILLLITGIPIFLIAFAIIAIVRLIIRATKKKSDSELDPRYNPPPQQGPYGNYNNPPQSGTNYPPYQNPAGPQQPPPYQQPDYTKQTPPYQAPNYTQPNYGSPNYTQPSAGTRRSTAIPGGNYQTHIPDRPKSRIALRVLLVVAIAALAIAMVITLFGIPRSVTDPIEDNANWDCCPEFTLAYENPSESTYTLILDGWDSIAIPAYSASFDLDYTPQIGQTEFKWKIIDDANRVIVDTTVTMVGIDRVWSLEEWEYASQTDRTIVFNPSRSTFVNWQIWYGENEEEELVDLQLGDSLYVVDAFTLNDVIIFDTRDPEALLPLEDVSPFSDLDKAEVLVSERDFHVLYANIYEENPRRAEFNELRNMMIELYADITADFSGAKRDRSNDELLDRFYVLIPPSVTSHTQPDDFRAALEYVRAEKDFFADRSPNAYYELDESADEILAMKAPKNAHPERLNYPPLTLISYEVETENAGAKMPVRKIKRSAERKPNGK